MKQYKQTKEPIAYVPEDPALTPEGRENQLISQAENLAEKQIREGTASAQVIVHYLRLGAQREHYRLECEKLKYETELLQAKKESLESVKRSEELMEEAIKAFRSYRGEEDEQQNYQNL